MVGRVAEAIEDAARTVAREGPRRAAARRRRDRRRVPSRPSPPACAASSGAPIFWSTMPACFSNRRTSPSRRPAACLVVDPEMVAATLRLQRAGTAAPDSGDHAADARKRLGAHRQCFVGDGAVVRHGRLLARLPDVESGPQRLDAASPLPNSRRSPIKVNSVCPGWCQTDMGGKDAARSADEGAKGIVWAALLPDDGPSGGFFRDGQADRLVRAGQASTRSCAAGGVESATRIRPRAVCAVPRRPSADHRGHWAAAAAAWQRVPICQGTTT
jgi:hypothetical protein